MGAQVDVLKPGLLGAGRDAFAARYCSRRLMRMTRRSKDSRRRWDNSGVSHAPELHALLAQVLPCLACR